ncbi:MAG: alginate export family protein [Gammaproteobacteria bacterium]|nr:alginate export family protein [Gammaproteobacteria bacterium]
MAVSLRGLVGMGGRRLTAIAVTLGAALGALIGPSVAVAEDGLSVDFSHRTRFEGLHNQFRPGLGSSDHGVVLRTRLAAEYARGAFRLGGEVLDARAYDLAPGSSADGNLIDAFEPLTAYVGWDGAVSGNQTLSLRLGRLAPTLGAGRLLGRNGYRNTPNAFTGAMATLTRGERRLELFALSPQQRLPNDFEAVRDNEWDLDEEQVGVRVLGAYLTTRSDADDQLEAYGFVLRERDDGLATRNRRLQTLGGRWLRAPAPGAWDGELEAALQWGQVRATAASDDGAVLDARAEFFHAALGVTGEGAWTPRVAALLDYASGDDDPTDNRWGRFDALFGPVRGDLGPTSLFTHVLRGNFLSPALRLEAKPTGPGDPARPLARRAPGCPDRLWGARPRRRKRRRCGYAARCAPRLAAVPALDPRRRHRPLQARAFHAPGAQCRGAGRSRLRLFLRHLSPSPAAFLEACN